MADMVATLGLGLDASQLTLGLPNVERLLQNVATAATAAKTAQASYNTAAKIAAPSSNASDITAQFRALQALNEAKKVAAQTEQTLAAAQASRMEIARTMQPLIIANTQIQLENVKAILAGVNATSAQIAMDANAAMAKRDEAAAAAAATAATQALGAAQAAATPATQAATTATQAAATATQALAQQQAAVVPAAQAAAAATNAAKAANEKAEKQAVTLRDVLAKLGLAYTGGQVVRAVGEVLTLAARYQTLGVVLDVVGRNVGKSRQEMRGLSESLQETGISAIASREELARMAAANLNLSQAAEVARVAQNAAVIAGVNSSAAFERVITAITTQQPRVLRTIGIYVNFEAAQEKYAKAAGRRMEQLTGQERAQINLDTALKGGAQVVGAYAAAMDTAGKQLTSTVRYMQDMKTQLGETFLPEFTFAVKAYAATLKFVGDNASWLAPILGGVLVTAVLLAAGAVAVLAAGLVAITLPIEAVVAAVAAGVAAMAFFGFTAKKARESTADLNKKLDEDSVIVTAYTQKIQKMSVALLEAEKRQLALQGAADFDLLSGLGSEVIAARKTVDAKPDYRATLAERSQTAANNVAALAAAEKAYADALRMSGIREQEAASLLQELSKRSTEAAGATDDATEAADKAAKKFADYQKTLREANDALLISAAAMEAGAAPTLAQQRALEDLNAETELAAKILDIQAETRGKDATLTKEQAANLVLLTQQTGANAAALVAATRAYADLSSEIERQNTLREEQDALYASEATRLAGANPTIAQTRALEDLNAETALAVKILAIKAEVSKADSKYTQEYAAELIRLAVAQGASEAATRAQSRAHEDLTASQNDVLAGLKAEIAIMQTRDAGQKRELAYLTLRTAKVKEYSELIRQGQVPAGKTAEEMADEFVELTRLQDTLKDSADAWSNALRDVLGVTKSIAGAFGASGRQVASALSALEKVYEITKKVDAAASVARAAQAVATASPTAANKTAASAAGSAAAATALSGGLAILTVAFTGMKYYYDSVRASSKAAEEAAIALRTLGDAARKSASGYALQASGTPLENTLAQLEANFRDIITKLLAAGAPRTELLGQRKAVSTKPTAEDVDNTIRAYEKLVAAAKRAAEFQVQQANEELRAREEAAAGNDELAEAIRQQITNLKELEDAHLAGADAAQIQRLQTLQLAEATTRAAKKAEEVRRSVFDTENATRAFTDPRGAGLAALDENAARRYNDAATAAEKAAVALFNVAERADYLAQQLEADRRTTESLTARIMGTYDTRGAEDLTRAASQRQEMADAIRSGMSETNIALLRFAQFAENSAVLMARNIEDGTAAINKMTKDITDGFDRSIEAAQTIAKLEIERLDGLIASTQAAAKATAKNFERQIDEEKARTKVSLANIDEQLKVAKVALGIATGQAKSLEDMISSNIEVVAALKEFSDSLKLGEFSTLSPEGKLREARAQFDTLATAAQGGDAEAAKKLPDAANALLDASRGFNASNTGFVADYDRVQSVIAAISAQYGVDLPVQEQQLLAAQATVERLNQTIERLNAQKDAIQEASARQIETLNAMKDKAAEDAQKVIEGLNAQKDKVTKDTEAIVTNLQEQKKAVEKSAADQIATLIANETQAHADRLQTNAYWKTYLGYIGASDAPIVDQGGGGITDIDSGIRTPAKSVAASQLTETKALNTRVDTMITRLEQLVSVAVAASDDEVDATRDVSRGVTLLIAETRNAAQAASARTMRVTSR